MGSLLHFTTAPLSTLWGLIPQHVPALSGRHFPPEGLGIQEGAVVKATPLSAGTLAFNQWVMS